jgi:hypothetical protein
MSCHPILHQHRACMSAFGAQSMLHVRVQCDVVVASCSSRLCRALLQQQVYELFAFHFGLICTRVRLNSCRAIAWLCQSPRSDSVLSGRSVKVTCEIAVAPSAGTPSIARKFRLCRLTLQKMPADVQKQGPWKFETVVSVDRTMDVVAVAAAKPMASAKLIVEVLARTSPFTLHTSHNTIPTSHLTLRISHCMMHTAHNTLHNEHFTLFTLHPSLCTQCTS